MDFTVSLKTWKRSVFIHGSSLLAIQNKEETVLAVGNVFCCVVLVKLTLSVNRLSGSEERRCFQSGPLYRTVAD